MNPVTLLVRAAALCAGWLLASAAIAAPAPNLAVSLALDTAAIDATQDVVVHVSITNTARHPVHVLKWYTPADEVEEALFRVTRDGVRVPYLGAHYKRPAPTARDYLKLAPGETLVRDVELSALYDMTQTGSYEIRYEAGSIDLVGNPAAGAARRRVDELRSNAVQLWIQGDGSAKAAAKGPPGGGGATCSNSQLATLSTARTDAIGYADNAKAYFNAKTLSTRYTKWFGAFTQSRYDRVAANFVAIRAALPAVTFDCSCRKSYYAYVYPTQPYKVYLCNAFWSAPARGTDSKAGTLIHETSHFDVVAGTDDWAYGQTAAASLAISDPAKAISNADNDEYFAENTPAL